MKNLQYLNKYFWKYRGRLLMGTVFILLTNVFNVYAPILVGEGIDFLAASLSARETLQNGTTSVIVPGPSSLSALDKLTGSNFAALELTQENLSATVIKIAVLLSLGYLLFFLIKGIFLFYQRQTIIVMSRHIEYDLKNEIYRHYQKMDGAFYKRYRTGDLMNRISEDVNRVRMYLGPAVMYTINLIVLVVMCVAVMWNIDVELTAYTLAPLPFMMIGIFYVSTIINRRTERVQHQQSKLSTMVQESISGIRLLKAFHKEQHFSDTFQHESDVYKALQMRLVKADALFMPVIGLLVGLSTLLTVYIGSLKVIEGGITYGVIVQFVFYVNQLTWPFASVGWVSSLVQKAEASQERINDFLRTSPDIADEGELNEVRHGKITFEKVSFTYPESGIQALKNVSFEVPAGECLGIMGRTGSGKSTIAQLLLRMYEPTEGRILIDDVPLQRYNLGALRSAFGYVPQEVFLFSESIANNIAFGEDRVNLEHVQSAAQLADVHTTILSFPQQYDTLLGERGINLSGGQKQRVAIARALIRSKTMLVLDDCLSAVDTATEENILRSLEKALQRRTSIINTHRVSSIKLADKVLVLDQGCVLEYGTTHELLALKGTFASTFKRQMEEQAEQN